MLRHFRPWPGALVAALGLAAALPQTAQAQFIQTSTGLNNPGTTFTFNEAPNRSVNKGDSVTNQFSNYGLTFSNVIYDTYPGNPNIGGGADVGNFVPNVPATNPFSVFFATPQSQAALDIGTRTDYGTFEIDAYLNGTQVGTTTVNRTAFAASPFVGYDFSPSSGKTFNELRLNILSGGDNAALIDEVQFGTPAPEPSQTAALGLGFLGLGALTLRARKRRAA